MRKIVVFDSGLGSLSIIKEIQKIFKCQIIYFADGKNFPYGKKTKRELKNIIDDSIKLLQRNFNPDFIIVASNTPTLVLKFDSQKILGVTPPLIEASKISLTRNIGILATSSTVKSNGLKNYIKETKLDAKYSFYKIDSSKLVELVESGKFLTNVRYCKKIIRQVLGKILSRKNIDVCTLSSTHLPFLKPILVSEFPNVKFLDPSEKIAKNISKKMKKENGRNSLKIYTSGNVTKFQKKLRMLGIKNRVSSLSF